MKTKIGIVLTAAFALAVSFGCSKDEAEKVAPTVLKAETNYAAPGGTGVIELSDSPSTVSVVTGGEWCAASANGAVINLTVQKNVYMMGRVALVTVSYPGFDDIRIPVTQAGGSIVPSFQESWETYNGDLSLSNWTIQKDDESGVTWEISDVVPGWYGDAYPTSGSYLALIGFDYSAAGMMPQDQWLISPSFTVKENNQLSFDEAHAPIWMYYDGDLHFEDELFTLKVKISDNNGATWTELFDSAEHNRGRYDEGNVYDYLDPIWESIVINLSAYAGKEVKIAFHSIGTFPDYNGIDNVQVGIMKEFANPPVRSAEPKKNQGLSFSGNYGISFEKKTGKAVKKLSPVEN
ncbi:MAG: choice-of-anchor J domain-containing protein [Dysgonamonadaceae bacterium]|jgi:hypothetical protein|nr:choice-of-anchor J domain-containing protein [Dysgonamonadaceae bacterium]